MIADILFPYQVEAVNQIVQRRRQALFDDPGSGKTVMSLGVMEADGLFDRPSNILVLAVKTGAELTWARDAARWVPEHVEVVTAYKGSISGRRRTVALAAAQDRPTLVLGNHALIDIPMGHREPSPSMWDVKWDMIVIDESQLVLPSEDDYPKDMTRFWRGLSQLKTDSLSIRLCLSGTPDRGYLPNRYGTWRFLLPERYNSSLPYETWLLKNFKVRHKRIRLAGGRRFIEKVVAVARKDPDGWDEMESVMTIRRTKAEIAPELPPKRHIPVILPRPMAFDKQTENFVKFWMPRNLDGSEAQQIIYVRAQQFATCEWEITRNASGGTTATPIPGCVSPKRDWIINWLAERDFSNPEGRAQVVITSQYTEVLKWLKMELSDAGYVSDLLTGAQSLKERLAVQRSFQDEDDPLRIVLLSEDLGNSIDLDMADDIIFIDEPQDPDVAVQVEDRCHRVSRVHSVFVWQLRTKGTIDEIVARAADRRFKETREVYDGRRGVSFTKEILATLIVGGKEG